MLAYFPHDYGNDNLNPTRLAADLAQARQRATGLTNIMDLYGIGDHGGGPTRAVLDQGVHWADPSMPAKVVPQIVFGTAQSYFDQVNLQNAENPKDGKIAPDSPEWDYRSIAKGYTPPPAVPGKISIPTWKSELYFEYHRGVMTSQANHKRNMRESSIETLNAEKWASLAWLDGQKYPAEELTEDWKKVLFNQFHDLAAGSGIGVIYKDAQKDYDVVRWSTNEISAGALNTVAERIKTDGDGIPILVYNPLGWERSGEVTVKVQFPCYTGEYDVWEGSGKASRSEAVITGVKQDKSTGLAELTIHVPKVPALGYKILRVANVLQERGPATVSKAIETATVAYLLGNDHVRATVDKTTGCITQP